MTKSSPSILRYVVKFIYFEKATKFEEISLSFDVKVHIFWEGHKLLRNLHLTFDCMYCTCKSKGKISQNFVAFSEYMNFMDLAIKISLPNFDDYRNCVALSDRNFVVSDQGVVLSTSVWASWPLKKNIVKYHKTEAEVSFNDENYSYSSNKIRKTQNEHLIILCQNLIGL